MVRNFRERELSKTWRVLTSPLFLLFLLISLGIIGQGTWNMYLKSREAYAGKMDVEHSLTSLTEREKFLKGEVDRLNTQAGLEQAIREAFNVSKDGEKVYVIVDKLSATGTPNESVAASVIHWFQGLFTKRKP